ncbi:MAG: PEP-CTERM sorting domain-containing protein [Planctomycetota bacterium]
MITRTKQVLCTAVILGFCSAGSASAAVIGDFQFNSDGDTEGWIAVGNSSEPADFGASGGTLNGTAEATDPQIVYNPDLTIDAAESWTTIEYRIRERGDLREDGNSTVIIDAGPVDLPFDPLGAGIILNGSFNRLNGTDTTAVASGDGFFTVTVDISAFAPDTITSVRLDPIGGGAGNSNSDTNGNTFEIDYITVNATPEPSSLALMGLGALAMIRRRRV